jgi:PAS domain S-box-containing protein
VEAPLESRLDEAARLRGCLNDVVGIMALPALWASGEPDRIGNSLVDAMLEMLDLAFVFLKLNEPETGGSTEIVRFAASLEGRWGARELSKAIDLSRADGRVTLLAPAGMSIPDLDVSVSSARLGLAGEIGMVVVGCERRDFPSETERLLLELAANQATIALQQALILRAQKRLTNDLDERVADRTMELATANELLKHEIAERRRTEEALRESEHESRLIVDSIPGMIALLAATGDLEVGNRQMLEYFGQTIEQLRGWGTNDTIHPDDLPDVIDVFSRSIASGSSYQTVQRFKRADGVYRWFFNRGFPLRDGNGVVVRWCVLLTDIDERKRSEDALRASELNLRQLTETIPEMLWSATPDGAIDYCNTRFLEYTGFSASDVRADGWQKTIHPDDAVRVAPVWMSCIASGAAYSVEVRTLHAADATYRWCAVNARPLFDAHGRIVKWHGSIVDMHDRKQAQHEVQRAHDHLTEAQRLSQTGSFSLDLDRNEHYWSDEFYRICEFEAGSPVTINRLRDIVHPEDAPSCETAIGRAMAGTEPDFDFRIVTGRGAVKHLRAFAHRIADRPVFVGAVQDVTAGKMAQEALNKAGVELAHVSRVTSLSALTASVAHEVNQPLSGIMTNAGTCLRMLDSTPPDISGARETARRTIRDANRASDVITRLRALFSKRPFALEPLNLNEVTREVIALSSNDLQANRTVLRSELADELPVVTGDRIQLQQVVLNLLRNASDAMVDVDDRPRQVLLRTVPDDGGGVRVTVRDCGVGVPLASMDSVFHPFYTTKSGGMGIGLFVSRSIVEQHRGRLWVERNDDGRGVTFSFVIPFAAATAGTPAPTIR